LGRTLHNCMEWTCLVGQKERAFAHSSEQASSHCNSLSRPAACHNKQVWQPGAHLVHWRCSEPIFWLSVQPALWLCQCVKPFKHIQCALLQYVTTLLVALMWRWPFRVCFHPPDDAVYRIL
jgi:hypothetical protein